MNFSRAAVVALALLAPAFAYAARVEPEVQPETKARAVASAPKARHSTPVELAAPSAAERAIAVAPPKKGEPPRIGFGRAVGAMGDEGASGGKLAWEDLASGGKVASVTITSPEAAAVRLGIRVKSIPESAIFRFHAAGSTDTTEAKGREILEAIARNLEAGEANADAHIFWSPPIESPSAVMEIELPAGVDPKQVRIAVPQVSHLTASARTSFIDVITKASATCENDAMCVQSTWGQQMNAVARMVFTSGGSSYLCTGTLLADSDTSTQVPYFLTANHCINSQTVASSLVTYWFYRSASCNSGTTGSYQTLSGGATLLYNTTYSDTSFLRLNTTPPAGAVYAGWTTDLGVGPGSAIGALHHPKGDLLKYSEGSVDAYLSCTAPVNGSFSCNLADVTNAGFYDVVWSSGVVEPGSSGSGLFLQNGRYLVGQLYGGSSTCTDPTAGDTYGRFDVAYNAGLAQWLGPQAAVALAVSIAGNGLGTVASSPAGISCPGTCSAGFTQGATVTLTATAGAASTFAGWTGACSGTGTCTVAMNTATSVGATFSYSGASWPPTMAAGTLAYGYGLGGTGWSTITGAAGVDTYEGGTAMKSNPTANGSTALVNYASQFSGGTVAFARRVSSGSDGGVLRFYIDGAQMGSWAGEVPWGLVSYPIGAGLHTLAWIYDKTSGGTVNAGGQDAAWIDAVNLPSNTPPPPTIKATVSGTGSGTVTSAPAGMNCTNACTASFAPGATVTLTPQPNAGARFDGWGGACSGTGSCTLQPGPSTPVTATFTQVAGLHKRGFWSRP